MKKLTAILALALCLALLAGCAGTTVVYTNCTCSAGGTQTEVGKPAEPLPEGAVKTGLAIVTKITGTDASGETAGKVEYDVTMVAVNVDDRGVITGCVIDSLGTSLEFDGSGEILTDTSVAPATKNELGASYGMVAYGHAVAEWDAQAGALASYAVGRTVEELKNGAIDETGYAADADLASGATIYLGGYVSAIEEAVNNARHLGAQSGDQLKLVSLHSFGDSAKGNGQLNCDVAALTLKDGVITSCLIDAVQAKAAIDEHGAITTDLTAPVQTKNQLGEAYGMKAWGNATYEWNEQAANFAAYVTGKRCQDVSGIAVTEAQKPADADLAASVTISIGTFQSLIAKAGD